MMADDSNSNNNKTLKVQESSQNSVKSEQGF